MSYLVTGKIHFAEIPSYDEMTELSYFWLDRVIENRIGVNLNVNLTANARYKYPLKNYINEERYMPYEITESPWPGSCEKIFTGDLLRLYDVQKFFEDIIMHEMISYITFELEDINNGSMEFLEHEIKANQFFQTITYAINKECATPILRLKICK